MNIFQILGEIDAFSRSELTQESVQGLQDFLEKEAQIPFDPELVISPEFCKELHRKGIELLQRGYPGAGEMSSANLIVLMLSRRFGCTFPFQVPEYLQPEDGTGPVFDIYRRFAELILDPEEHIEYVDLGAFSFYDISPISRGNLLWKLSSSSNGRIGAIVVTNQRFLAVGALLPHGNKQITLKQFLLYDMDSPQSASIDFIRHDRIQDITLDKRWKSISFVAKDMKYFEKRELMISIPQPKVAHYQPPKVWLPLHSAEDVKRSDFGCHIILWEVYKQKKDVLKDRYRTLETSLSKFKT
jgi:hypothetical protein